MVSELHDDAALAAIEGQIDEWLARFAAEYPVVAAIDRGERSAAGGDERRWFVRMTGDAKDFTTIWLTLGQRTLRYETYVMSAPVDNAAELYEYALRRNDELVGVQFSIGSEDALFLRGALPLQALDQPELDRVLGTLYATVERYFPALIRLGFARHFP